MRQFVGSKHLVCIAHHRRNLSSGSQAAMQFARYSISQTGARARAYNNCIAASKQKMSFSVYVAGRPPVQQQQQILSGYGDGGSPALSLTLFSPPHGLFLPLGFSATVSFFLSPGLPRCICFPLTVTSLRLVHWKAWRPNEDVSTRPALVHGRAFVLRPSLLHLGDKAASLALYRSFQTCQIDWVVFLISPRLEIRVCWIPTRKRDNNHFYILIYIVISCTDEFFFYLEKKRD